MDLPTVRDAWRLALPTGTQLLAGESGLANPVRWVQRMALHAPAFAEMQEGDLVLVPVEAISYVDDRLSLAQIVQWVLGQGASGVVALGTGLDGAKEHAEAAGFPLLALPAGADLRDVERDVARLVVNHEAQLDRRGRVIYRRLAQLFIENRGLEAVAQAAAQMTAKAVVIQDADFRPQASAPSSCAEHQGALVPPQALSEWISQIQLDSKSPPCRVFAAPGDTWGRCVAAVVMEGSVGGYVTILGPRGELDELDALVAERAALVCAAEFAKRRAVAAVEDRLWADLVDLLAAADSASEAVLARRLTELGYATGGHHAAIALSQPDPPGTPALLLSRVKAGLDRRGVESLIIPGEGGLLVLLPSATADGLAPLARWMADLRDPGDASGALGYSAGIGLVQQGIAGLRASVRQAREALALATDLLGGGRDVAYGELARYHLFAQLRGTAPLAAFHGQVLAPLVAYDQEHDAQLVPTLEAYFAHHGNATQAAEALYLHRNSLLYRLERIQEISGLDLDDPEDRFSLHLALKLLPLIAEK